MYCYVWRYEVKDDRLENFQTLYGPDGDWVRLFRRDPEYVRTILLRDRQAPACFMTLDFWSSQEAYLAFRERFSMDLETLDRLCAGLTVCERQIGELDTIDPAGAG
jgi:hypothetical protein